MNDKWEFYKDIAGQWRWRRIGPDGTIVGTSTEGCVDKAECEENARRNGWEGHVLTQEEGDRRKQNNWDETNRETKSKAYALYKEHGFKNGNDFVEWLESERQVGEESRSKRKRQMKNIIFSIIGILFVIAAILLMMQFKKTPETKLSAQNVSQTKIMMIVLDPKPDEKVVIFGDTHFGFDQFTLSQEAKMSLDKDVQRLKENPNIDVRMAGYTSAMGSEEGNQKLSEQRANAVRDYLIEKGIAPERITVIGYGRTRPAVYEVAPEDTSSTEARENMRVLFEIVVH